MDLRPSRGASRRECGRGSDSGVGLGGHQRPGALRNLRRGAGAQDKGKIESCGSRASGTRMNLLI
jgi:hypothetical protein